MTQMTNDTNDPNHPNDSNCLDDTNDPNHTNDTNDHSCTLFDPRERGSLHIKKNLYAHFFKGCQILFYKLYIDKSL